MRFYQTGALSCTNHSKMLSLMQCISGNCKSFCNRSLHKTKIRPIAQVSRKVFRTFMSYSVTVTVAVIKLVTGP